MEAITETVTAITKMIRGGAKAVSIDTIVGHPILNSVRHLIKQLTAFVNHFTTTK